MSIDLCAARLAAKSYTRLSDDHICYAAGSITCNFKATPLTLYLTFTGTNEVADWFTNLRVKKVPCGTSGGRMHVGFRDAIDSILSAPGFVQTFIRLSRNRRVVLVGHSLGGALAEAFGHRLFHCPWFCALANRPIVSIRSFGAPRVGDNAFAAELNALVPDNIKYAHVFDVVPLMPFRSMLYVHAGNIRRVFSWCRPLTAHRIETYIDLLMEI